MADTKKSINDLELATPSTAATVVGEDGGVAKRFPVSSFGGGGGIVTVDALPTEGDASVIYKMPTIIRAEAVFNQAIADDFGYFEVVNELPEIGHAGVDLITTRIYAYYQVKDGTAYVYADATIATAFGVSQGWLPYANAMAMSNLSVAGTVETIEEATESDKVYILITKEPRYYMYNDAKSKYEECFLTSNIKDVDRLPTAEFNTKVIYRVPEIVKGMMVADGTVLEDVTAEIVDEFPDEPVESTQTDFYVYVSKYWQWPYYYGGGAWHSVGKLYNSAEECTGDGVLAIRKPRLYYFVENGDTIEKKAVITSENFEFDETTGTLVLNL